MTTEKQKMNIPRLTVTKTISKLANIYASASKKNIPFSQCPTAFLWGGAGIGKSQGVLQLANIIEKETQKTVTVTDVRLLLFNPIDLRGIPTANQDKTLAVWLKPQIFNMDESDSVINILFLDELSAAPQSVQAAAYQICLDRRVGEHKLPENCIVIAAGNRTTDKSISYKMPKALCNRLMHYDIAVDYSSWRKWALDKGINSQVIAYLGFDNSRLYVEPDSSDYAFPTPRSWEFVSNLLEITGDTPEQLYDEIASCIGNDTALEFKAYCKGCLWMPDVQSIFKGTCKDYPNSPEVTYALLTALVSEINNNSITFPLEYIENAINYTQKLPKDFFVSFVTDLLAIDEINHRLMASKFFKEIRAKNKRFF